MTHSERGTQILGEVVKLFSTEGCPIVNYAAKGFIKFGNKPSDNWSLGNRILMLVQNTQDARGYNQWREAGRSVKKGAKAIYILRPLIAKRKEIQSNGTEKEISFVHGFAGLPVFRLEDTDIIDADKWTKSLGSDVPPQFPRLTDVAQKWGIAVKYDKTLSGEFGSINLAGTQIRLCTKDESTFFHELGHAADMKNNGGKLKPGQDTDQEIVAELTAAVLARVYGFNVDAETYTYITAYIGSRNPKDVGVWCVRLLTRIEKAISLILTTKEELDSIAGEIPA